MRLSAVNCVLLACLAFAVATEHTRTKRDFSFLKNLIVSKLFGASQIQESEPEPELVSDDGNVKIFRIPGFEEILVKAVPKKPVPFVETEVPISVEVEEKDPRLTILESYLGTKSPEQTLAALQGIKNLLESGVVGFKEEGKETVETTNLKEPVYVLPPIMVQEPPKVSVTKPIPTTHPGVMQLFAEQFPLQYLYQQQHKDGAVTNYYSKDGKKVVVTESKGPPPPLPQYIIDRLQVVYGVPASIPEPGKPEPPVSAFELPKPVLVEKPKPSSNGEHIIVFPEPLPLDVIKSKAEEQKPLFWSTNDEPYGIDVRFPSAVSTQTVVEPSTVTVEKHTIKQNDVTCDKNNLHCGPMLTRPFINKVPTKSGYTYTLVDDEGFYQNRDGNILYSHLVQHPTHDTSSTPPSMNSNHINENPKVYPLLKDSEPIYDTKGEVFVTINKKNGQVNTESTRQGMYSYKQIHPDGTSSFSNAPKLQRPTVLVTESIEKVPALPSFIFDRIDEAAAIAHSTQFPKIPLPLKPGKNIAAHPTIGTHVNKFAYTQIKTDGSSNTYEGTENEEKESPGVSTNRDKSTQTSNAGFAIGKVNEKQPGTVIFKKPVVSRYMYKQIGLNSQEPFTIVKVEDKPSLSHPYKLNWHEHLNMDGSKYMCPFGNIHVPQPPQQLISGVPREYVYVPPLDAVEPLPEKAVSSVSLCEEMSSQQKSVHVEEKAEVTPTEEIIETTTSDSIATSWNSEPIVVDEQDSADTQINTDAPMEISGEKSTVSIQVNENETIFSVGENISSDMPEASS